jgi:prepilin-type N-terminal cleavage/methylation domain-containing protein
MPDNQSRHSRAGGNPVAFLRVNQENRISACAGMTAVILDFTKLMGSKQTIRHRYALSVNSAAHHAAFTLVEMAVVVVIAGIILSSLLPALLDIRRTAQFTATQTNLQTLLRATAAYTLANGCLPCPTPGDKINASGALGKVRGDNSAGAAACGNCPIADGIAPFVSLGVDPSVAKDGWGRWITYHIDRSLANPTACTETEKLANNAGCSKTDAVSSGLCRAGLAATGNPLTINLPNVTSARAAVIFISHGVNGAGAYRLNANATQPRLDVSPCETAKGNVEGCNVKSGSNVNDNSFYVYDRSERVDDIITYMDRNALVSLFGNAACTTPW